MTDQSEADLFKKTIISLVYDKYNSLKVGGKPQEHEWTVLASIIKEEDGKFEVIVITTGTKCVGEHSLSSQGLLVNDCHAEVLARRCFILYLMDQIANCKNGMADQSVFQLSTDPSFQYILKDGIHFHLYISQSPCGYASEYYEEEGKRKALEIANAKVRASKRRCLGFDEVEVHFPCQDNTKDCTNITKQLKEEGESYHRTGAKYDMQSQVLHLSTKPGRGDPSRSYSCSDKLCMYNHIGYQGGLLSTFLPPIYMKSIIISGQWDEERMKEALIQRVSHPADDSVYTPPVIYRCPPNSPLSESEVVKGLKGKRLASSGSSLLWIAPNQTETLIAGKGVRLGTNVKKGITKKNASKICPSSLLSVYHSLAWEDGEKKSYWSIKRSASTYQERKSSLFAEWKRKDRQLLAFCE